MNIFFSPASEQHQKKEKAKARELRQSSWWKQTLGRGICYHCEQRFPPKDLTMDHLIPISRGGKSDKKNCVPSCKECNTKKGYKTRAEMVMEEMAQVDHRNGQEISSDGECNNDDSMSLSDPEATDPKEADSESAPKEEISNSNKQEEE